MILNVRRVTNGTNDDFLLAMGADVDFTSCAAKTIAAAPV